MKTWLVVFLLLNGQWVPGAQVKGGGWAPRAYASMAECEKRRRFAVDSVRHVQKRMIPMKWFCATSPDATLAELEKSAPEKSAAQGR